MNTLIDRLSPALKRQAVRQLRRVKIQLRDGPYAWPGGYPKFALMMDGETMHLDCIRENWREVCRAHIKGDDKQCLAVDINWEDADMVCCQCNKPIESAYGED